MKHFKIIVAVSLFFFAIATVSNASSRVSYKRGDVTARIGDSWRPAVTGMELPVGSQVKTGAGAMAEITLAGGTLVRMRPGSTLDIPPFQEKEESVGVVSMLLGRIWVRARRGTDFEVETSSAIAGVRGTIFTVNVDLDGQTEISVFDGQVSVASPTDITRAAEVQLERAQRVRVRMEELPSAIETFDPDTEVDDFVTEIEEDSENREEPSLSILAPSAGQRIRGSRVRIEGSVSREADIIIYIDGEQHSVISSVSGAFSRAISTRGGRRNIRMIARTPSGMESDPEQVEVEVEGSEDTTPPRLSVTEPLPNAVFEREPITVRGNAVDDEGPVHVTVLLDGSERASFSPGADGAFSINISDITAGSHDLEIIAEDEAGNRSAPIQLQFEMRPPADETPPTILITSPGPVESQLPVRLAGTATDNVQVRNVTAVLNDVSLGVIAGSDGEFDVELPTSALRPANTLTIRAVDTSDLSTTVTVDFEFDGEISSEAAGAGVIMLEPVPPSVDSSVITISGQVVGIPDNTRHIVNFEVSPAGDPDSVTVSNSGDRFAFTTTLYQEETDFSITLMLADDPDGELIASAQTSVTTSVVGERDDDAIDDPDAEDPEEDPEDDPDAEDPEEDPEDDPEDDPDAEDPEEDPVDDPDAEDPEEDPVDDPAEDPDDEPVILDPDDDDADEVERDDDLYDYMDEFADDDPDDPDDVTYLPDTDDPTMAPDADMGDHALLPELDDPDDHALLPEIEEPEISVDMPPPAMLVIAPAVSDGPEVSVQISLQGGEAGVDYRLDLTLNGAPAGQVSIPANGSVTRTVTGLQPGENDLVVSDPTGVIDRQATSTNYLVDMTPPVVIVTAPLPGIMLNERTANLEFTLTKDTRVRIELNGSSIFEGMLSQGSHSRPVNVRRGPNTARFTGQDEHGNQMDPVDWHFRGDDNPPQVIMIQPSGSATYSFDQPPLRTEQTSTGYRTFLNVQGLVIDEENSPIASVRVVVNGARTFSPTVSSGQFQVDVELETGANTIAVTARDSWDNESAPVISTITVSHPPLPVIVITRPVADKTGSTSPISSTLTGSIVSYVDFSAEYTLNNESTRTMSLNPVIGGSTSFSESLSIRRSGRNVLKVVVIDSMGRRVEETVTFNASFSPPPLPSFDM